jgi:hypothetical protein
MTDAATTATITTATASGPMLRDPGAPSPPNRASLDSALAAWMSKQRHGGKPVVLRRRLD